MKPFGTKNIVVLGAGESGVGAAVLAKKQGWNVFVSDFGTIKDTFKEELNSYQLEWEEGKHTELRVLDAQIVVKSPGIPDKAPIIKKLKEKNIPVISEIEFAGYYNTAKTICITGTNGKTTTTMLTYHILKKAGIKVGLAGNVGKSFAKQVAEEQFDWYVLELSSFQLDGMFEFKADVAILLNITPDHLDRYDYQLQNYVDSKFRILQNMGPNDWFIYNADDAILNQEVEKRTITANLAPFSLTKELLQGGFIKDKQLTITTNKKQFTMSIHDLALKGKHNAQNSLASGIAARILEIRK
ncbi:MAG TPA: UDP-N-acetylmuramoyl-L-alanine--D-glutamate ligase, partial [Taishania sp.]|nr:UDP-N-acetylmuramoyl-L-alanine--D-glutamate ligase [Taishania sp.]